MPVNDRVRPERGAIALGGFTIDPHSADLFDATGRRVLVRRQALAVLLELARNAGLVLSHDALVKAVWKDVFVTDDSLVQCIGEIRRALGPVAAAALRTVPRRGYVLEPSQHPGARASDDGALVLGAAPASPPPALPALSGLSDAPSHRLPALPFIGRDAELNALVNGFHLRGASGCLVLISGEPGIGKSRLIQEAAHVAASQGAAAVALKCHEIESGLTYGALSLLIDRLVTLADASALQTMDDISRAELAALAPGCAARLEPMAHLSETDASLRKTRLRAALIALCAAAGTGQRLILAIDDAHWLDEASAVTLFAVAQAAPRHGYSIWATLRPDEIARNPIAVPLVHELQELAHTRQLPLARLTPEHVARIVAQLGARHTADPAHVDWLVTHSAGNPFYLHELIQANPGALQAPALAHGAAGQREVLPPGILDAVLHRARHLPTAALRLLEAAAVLEQGAAFELLCRVASQEHDVGFNALETLMSAGWLVEDRGPERYPFAHDKLREAIYASVPVALRRNLHGRAVDALLDSAAQRGAAPEHAVVAAHAVRAGQEQVALEQFALAGDAARRLFELRRAETLYSQALSFESGPNDPHVARRMALLEKRGAVRSMLGAAAQAEADLRGAIGLAQSHPGATYRAALLRLQIELGVMLQRQHRLEEALGVLGQALELAQATGDAVATAAAHCWLGDVQWMCERNRAARIHFEAALGIDAPAGPALEAYRTKALFGLAQCAGMDARPALADALLDQALARAQPRAELHFECAWNVLKGWIRVGGHGMAEPEVARQHFERCLNLSRETDLFWYSVPCHIGLGVTHAQAQRFDAATEFFESTLRLPADPHNDRWRLAAGVWLASCQLEHGDPAAALATARSAQAALAEFGAFMFAAKLPALITIALVRLGRGDECEDLRPGIEQARRDEVGYAVLEALEAWAQWLHARADASELLACAQELLHEASSRALPAACAAAAAWRTRAQALGANVAPVPSE
jgi:DNA-binding winged helix-turn-helix (wHTH) protein/tetratricopeptide (TPR) repeat protein